MKLREVRFIGVRGVRDATYDLTDPATGAPADVVVFTGPPACGKTRALEAIVAAKEAIGPYGAMAEGRSWITSGLARVVLAFHLDEEERTYAGSATALVRAEATFHDDRVDASTDDGLTAVLSRYGHTAACGKVEYFPATRRLAHAPPFHGLRPADQKPLRAGKDPRKYSAVSRLLGVIAAGGERATAFATRLAALSPTVRFTPGSPSSEGAPRCLSSRGGPPLTAAELSDAEADAVLFAATATVLGLSRSLVLVDRPELHADPRFLPDLVRGLRALGEDNQLLLASSSPAVAASGRALSVAGDRRAA